jgi:hypothetical protein
MSDFPRLKTGAVAQYPATKIIEFATQVLMFVDGGSQRYHDASGPLRKWRIQLELLDESEARAIEEFFESAQGRFGSFRFTDPWDNTEYPDCSLDADTAELEWRGESRCRTGLIIRENRT